MRKFTRALLIMLGIFVAVQANAQNNANPGMLWKVTGNGLKQPSYLFGTYHLMKGSFLDTINVVQDALENTEAVYGEVVLDESPEGQQAMQQLILSKAMMQGTTLKDLYTEEEYKEIDEFFKANVGQGADQLGVLKPMMLNTMIIQIMAQKHIPEIISAPGPVLDAYVQKKAKEADKKVGELETIDFQISILYDSLTLEEQKDMLYESITSDEGAEALLKMNDAYMQSDLEGLYSLMYDETEEARMMYLLFDLRNINWVAKMPAIMKEQPTFFAVGVGHMVGKNGLLNLLKQEGYKIERIAY